MVVVNLWGAPGCGKSTGAAYIFSQLKLLGYNAELVTEFAKDLTWENNTTALDTQYYVSGVQAYKLARLNEKVDVVVTDSPLPIGLIYVDDAERKLIHDYIWYEFNKYENLNFYLDRVKAYVESGRTQTESESDKIAGVINNMLMDSTYTYNGNTMPVMTSNNYWRTVGDSDGYEFITKCVVNYLRQKGIKNGSSKN